MPVDERMRAQHQLILDNFGDAATYPAADRWDDIDDIDYLYRKHAILARRSDAARVTAALGDIFGDVGYGDLAPGAERQIRHEDLPGGVVRLMVPSTPTPVPELVARLDGALGQGVVSPEHKLYVCGYPCPADEPGEVPPDAEPVPAPNLEADDGDGVSVSIVDTGLMPNAAAGHPWLAGVRGAVENPYINDSDGEIVIAPYAGHGTFVAGVLRSIAPKASVFVERAFDIAGADYETRVAASLEDALNRNPDILVFTFTTSTHCDQPLRTFDDLYERRIRYVKGLVTLAPAGNEGQSRPMWPAAHPGVVSVGALAADGQHRAEFSNYGRWVDVYAPGEHLINAFPDGTYVCNEPPIGQHRHFHGLAKWSGTSFSTPVVAGLIAARMSRTGQNPQQAWDSLQRFAGRQSIPGVGPVLYPGQADGEPGH